MGSIFIGNEVVEIFNGEGLSSLKLCGVYWFS